MAKSGKGSMRPLHKPGNIIMQSADDHNWFIGIVTERHMGSQVDGNHRGFEQEPEKWLVALVLGWFASPNHMRRSIFNPSFPRYHVGNMHTAYVWNPCPEARRIASHMSDGVFDGITEKYLWQKILAPTNAQREAIALSVLAKQWVESGGAGHVPETWMQVPGTHASRLYKELQIALPSLYTR